MRLISLPGSLTEVSYFSKHREKESILTLNSEVTWVHTGYNETWRATQERITEARLKTAMGPSETALKGSEHCCLALEWEDDSRRGTSEQENTVEGNPAGTAGKAVLTPPCHTHFQNVQ